MSSALVRRTERHRARRGDRSAGPGSSRSQTPVEVSRRQGRGPTPTHALLAAPNGAEGEVGDGHSEPGAVVEAEMA
eukprot:7094796-Lingulodinium_polyedra.AAC.1